MNSVITSKYLFFSGDINTKFLQFWIKLELNCFAGTSVWASSLREISTCNFVLALIKHQWFLFKELKWLLNILKIERFFICKTVFFPIILCKLLQIFPFRLLSKSPYNSVPFPHIKSKKTLDALENTMKRIPISHLCYQQKYKSMPWFFSYFYFLAGSLSLLWEGIWLNYRQELWKFHKWCR